MTVRTRFAPSPTGHVHIGNMRTAIYNWLFARGQGGSFLVRIEDTDRQRSTDQAVRAVFDAMGWLELGYDETPLFQSTRLEAHLAAAEELLTKGLAYKSDKGHTGQGEAVVFRMPGTDIGFHDEIKGTLTKASGDLQDLVIVRSNGSPVFHLANVLDDLHMGITHVIRGDDHIENTYRHVALYHALGAAPPRFAHLPMIVNAKGQPYSKRDGDAFVGDFRDKGYLPEALFNYLTLLGWSPGDDTELMGRDELVRRFDLRRVQSSPARMDPRKLEWMNGEHLRRLPLPELAAGCRRAMEARSAWRPHHAEDYFLRVVDLMKDRIRLFPEFVDQAAYFFEEEFPYDEKSVKKRLLKDGAREGLCALRDRLARVAPFDAAGCEEALRTLAEERGIGAGTLVHPLRVAISGSAAGPGLFEMAEVMGRERVLRRIDRTLARYRDAGE